MSQYRETGARASRFGHQNGTTLIEHFGGNNRKPGSNELDLHGERVSIHSAHYRKRPFPKRWCNSTLFEEIDAVLGAFQDENGSYRILKLTADEFRLFSRPTASRGPSKGRVVLVKRTMFETHGKFVEVLPAQES